MFEDLPDEVRDEITFAFVDDVRQVLELALEPATPDSAGAVSGSNGSKTVEPKAIPEPKKRRTPPPSLPDVVPAPPAMH